MDNHDYYQKWLSRFLFLATPAFMYVIFEWITGNLLNIRGDLILWNLLFYYTFYFLLAAVTNRMKGSYLVLNLLFTVLAAAEYYVVGFRGRPIMLWDFMAIRTASTVAGGYTYTLTLRLVIGFLLMAGWSFLIWKFPFVMPQGKKRLACLGAAVAWTVGWFSCFFTIVVPARSIDVSMWNPVETFESRGYMLCTMRMVGYVRVQKPVEYQQSAVEQLYEALEEREADDGEQPLNIICIMNESWADLSVISAFETNEPYFEYYNSMSDNCVKGDLYVPVFGAGTSNSEYEFLTGNSMAFAPAGSVPYQIYMKNYTPSIVSSVKEQGYRTVAIHPYIKNNWNRVEAYNSLGFDEYLAIEEFEDAEKIRDYVSDKSCYDKIIEMTAHNQEEIPTFFFLITMQNHGGYDQDYEAQIHLTGTADYPLTEQYLSVIQESDRALEYLIEYYKESDQPTLIMMFGDHQPKVEEEFYENLFGSPLSDLEPEAYLTTYETPYFIWTNYENNLDDEENFSLLYLGNQVLKAANLPLDGYQNFLEELKQQVPVIHDIGYYDTERIWQSWTNWRTKDSYEWLHSFEWFQYYRMFGKKWE